MTGTALSIEKKKKGPVFEFSHDGDKRGKAIAGVSD